MKWLIFMLAGMNLALWLFLSGERVPLTADGGGGRLPRVASLELDAEVSADREDRGLVAGVQAGKPGQDIGDGQATEVGDQPATEIAVPSSAVVSPVCLEVGWFDDASAAREAAEELSAFLAEESGVRVREVERPADPYFWVIIPPAESRAAALEKFRELQARGIDSYLIREGERENAISLGLFGSRTAAERVLSRSQSRGLEAVLATFPRNKIGYSLVFEARPEPGSRELEEALAVLGSRFEEVKMNDCEGVATIQKTP